jgi:hypothetical protein
LSGLSHGEILELVPVAKSTLSGWLRDVELTSTQLEAIETRRKRKGNHRDTQWRRRLEIERIREEAAIFAATHLKDPFFVAGLCLYWGEGAKTRNRCSVANSDPALLRLFVAWVKTYLDPGATFTLSLHLHEGDNEAAAREYWAAETELAGSTFTKSYLKPPGSGHRKNHLPHGICRVRVMRPADHWNRVMTWIDVAAETLAPKLPSTSNIPSGR